MLTLNSDLRAQSRSALKGRWLMSFVACLIFVFFTGAASIIPLVGNVVAFVVSIVLIWGIQILFLKVYRNMEVQFEMVLDGFIDFGRIFGTLFLVQLYTALWTCLFVVPGIIKRYSYAMTSYVLKDEPGLSYNAAIDRSMQLMEGNKMKLFLLDFSFIGWALLSTLSCGIGFFFLIPYMQTAYAAFYEDLKQNGSASTE